MSLLLGVSQTTVHAATANPQCVIYAPKAQKFTTDIAAKETPLEQLRVKNSYNTAQAQVVFKTKVATAQKEANTKRAAIFKKLATKAKTTAQKQALATYKTEFTAALTTFHAAQDAARNGYLKTINDFSVAHRAAVDAARAGLKSQAQVAFTAATTSCQKIGPLKASAQLKSAIQAAQTSYATTPNVATQSVQASLKAAADSFKTANDSAKTTFDQSLQLSRATLKTAFGNTKYIF